VERVSSALKKDHLRIASVNVNGLRAAYKKGMAEWLAPRDVDILCLQEVRAPDAIVRQLLGEGWHILHAEAEAKGRAGVAIASRTEPVATRNGIGDDYFATAGRWVDDAAALRTSAAGRILRLHQPLQAHSATDLRQRIAAGASWRGLVPPAVADYIAEHRLYGYAGDPAVIGMPPTPSL